MYFEDVAIGQTYVSHAIPVTQDEIIAFAIQYDPQVQHIDPEGARHSIFGELVASGWHTAAMTGSSTCATRQPAFRNAS